eukprot:CAMPEP_0203966250 /NCGR_PEP_ID=MMETSP0359-20131031/95541_1 /ASSEMBLY_ACC=CAM_ASM_000338 /TAXON_ID=268821 /ORGANISM="Scrippsiella Hangoei, Strain SHTV-5" /LENGTH=66 /DNA_ID=CAMNT_0050903559 /DNA_START=207 /DNA_END=404 /DNA_ORIENTATION=+
MMMMTIITAVTVARLCATGAVGAPKSFMAAEPRFVSVADEAVTRTEQQYHRQQDQMIETLGRHRAR